MQAQRGIPHGSMANALPQAIGAQRKRPKVVPANTLSNRSAIKESVFCQELVRSTTQRRGLPLKQPGLAES